MEFDTFATYDPIENSQRPIAVANTTKQIKTQNNKFDTLDTIPDKKEGLNNQSVNDLWGLFTWIIKNLNFKLGIFLLIFIIFIFSDFFEETFLKPWGAMMGEQPTTYGSFIQYLFVAIIAIVLDFAIKTEIL